MTKKLVNIIYVIISVIVLLLIANVLVSNITGIVTSLKNYILQSNGFGETYDAFNEINRNISLIIESIIFSGISLIFTFIAMITTFIELKAKKYAASIKVGILCTIFLTLSYTNSLLTNYGVMTTDNNDLILVVYTVILIALTVAMIAKEILNSKKELFNKIYVSMSSLLLALTSFGMFSIIYVEIYKFILKTINDFLFTASQNGMALLAEKVTDQQLIEQLQGYVTSFVTKGSKELLFVISMNQKLELLMLFGFGALIIALIILLRKKSRKKSITDIVIIGVFIIVITFIIFNTTPNLITQMVLGGCEVC